MKTPVRPLLMVAYVLVAGIFIMTMHSCTSMPKQLTITTTGESFPVDSILSARSGRPVTFDALVNDLAGVQVVYLGEIHTNAGHHLVQARLIEALYQRHSSLSVGMEMFDHRYDAVLSQWSDGDLDRDTFIQKTHWKVRRSGWGYPFELYAPIFKTIQDNNIRLVGLNVPGWIPSKISAGGLDNLLPDERRLLAAEIDTSVEDHRAYVENVFKSNPHHQIKSFEYFYEAQCAWEDTMAESVARKMAAGPMVVVIGNGHIQYKYGVPNRAYQRNPVSFRTVYLAPVGSEVDLNVADYIWVTS